LLADLEIRAVPITAEPAALNAEPGSAKVALTWDAVVGADGYALYRRAVGGEVEALGTVSGNTFADVTGTVGLVYTCTVRVATSSARDLRRPCPRYGSRHGRGR
jgi:hypothetical protein